MRTGDTGHRNSLISEISRLAMAIALVSAALGLTWSLQNVFSTSGFLFFYAAVVLSAWFGGKWAGASAVVLSTLAVAYFFLAPLQSFAVDRNSLPIFVEFAASAAAASWFSSWRKHTEMALEKARNELQFRVEERTAELRLANEHLRAEMAERKRAEDAYSEAQAELARVTRFSALGALAASISHEVNQPLAAVVANADACAMWLASDPPDLFEVRAAIESIVQEGTRASQVVKHVRAMFSNAPPERVDLDINHLIVQVCGLMGGQASRNRVEVRTELAANLPETCGDRVQLQQVLMNLILNGIEAMTSVEDRQRRLVITSEMSAPGEIVVGVRDSGVGIAEPDVERIFDAFFTTKAQGMGMGLSICHSVIEAHGGRLWATANSDFGATLHFSLPLAPQRHEPGATAA